MHASRIALQLLAVSTCLAACSVAQPPGKGTQAGAPSSRPSVTQTTPKPKPRPAARIAITPGNGQKSVGPRARVTVTATGGHLASVHVTDSAGHSLIGVPNRAGTAWSTRGNLAYKQVYTVRVTAKNATGQASRATSTFHTAWPRKLVYPPISPLGAKTVGVGMPVVVYFPHPVKNISAVQAHMSVTSTPNQRGAWHWFGDNTEAHWRPENLWKAKTRVTVHVNVFGVELGSGYWGKTNRMVVFHIGARHVSIANSITHRMWVYDGTKRVQNFPVSMGKQVKGQWTHSGIHVVNAKFGVKTMDSSTFGLALDAPGGYKAKVNYATRISNNGEFVHSAPWSVKQQGKSNVSHGCINLSPERAKWFFRFSRVGDVVQVVGTPVPLTPKDGDVYDWTIPWKEWIA